MPVQTQFAESEHDEQNVEDVHIRQPIKIVINSGKYQITVEID